jgi:alpha-galactosidase
LSDLDWVGTPINGFGPVEKDTSNGETAAGDGHPIFINGANYAKGLGAHANSSIQYDLARKCTTFSAYVGADDEARPASLTFEVWVDGRRAYSSPALVTNDQPAVFLSIDVSCATSLRLVVTDGVVNSTTSDHGDWGDAKVVCRGRP